MVVQTTESLLQDKASISNKFVVPVILNQVWRIRNDSTLLECDAANAHYSSAAFVMTVGLYDDRRSPLNTRSVAEVTH